MTSALLAQSTAHPVDDDQPASRRAAPIRSPESTSFPAPRPNRSLMAVLGVVNRWLILRARLRVTAIDLPSADLGRLREAVNPDTAAFLAPNHAEFGLDWMIDKEISTMVAPHMGAWAAHEIIAGAPWFWTRNNLISNRGGEQAFEYSVRCALRGDGVLLHPEGMVRWTSDVVHPLFDGVARMAVDAAARVANGEERPVYIVPLVWKLSYTGDVSTGIHADMAHIERELNLPSGDGYTVRERFRRLQENVLRVQMTRFGFDDGPVANLDFFARQEAFRAYLTDELASRHGMPRRALDERALRRLAKTVADRQARARVREAERLGGFSRAVYDTPTLAQEHIHESLKRIRADLVTRGARNVAHNFLPTPYGPRVAHVRVPGPILIDPRLAAGSEHDRAAYAAHLTERTHTAMQEALDTVNREIGPDVDHFRRPNPFYTNTCVSPGGEPLPANELPPSHSPDGPIH